jgi:hypothetical protein
VLLEAWASNSPIPRSSVHMALAVNRKRVRDAAATVVTTEWLSESGTLAQRPRQGQASCFGTITRSPFGLVRAHAAVGFPGQQGDRSW